MYLLRQVIAPKDHISKVIQLAVIPWWSVCILQVTIVFVIQFTGRRIVQDSYIQRFFASKIEYQPCR